MSKASRVWRVISEKEKPVENIMVKPVTMLANAAMPAVYAAEFTFLLSRSAPRITAKVNRAAMYRSGIISAVVSMYPSVAPMSPKGNSAGLSAAVNASPNGEKLSITALYANMKDSISTPADRAVRFSISNILTPPHNKFCVAVESI